MTMDKSKLSLVIDALMFLCVMAIAGIGFLMKFVLLPGKDTWAVYGRKVDLFLFGMDRHQWGTIHLIIAFVFLGMITLHIVLHWNMIVSNILQVSRKYRGKTYSCHNHFHRWCIPCGLSPVCKTRSAGT